MVTVGTAFANEGSVGPDVNPSGNFSIAPLTAGTTINWSFEGISNEDGGVFDYTIELVSPDLASDFLVASGTFTGPAGSSATATYVPVSGSSAALPSAIDEFTLRVTLLNNTGGVADQVGIDDIVLDAVPEPSVSLLGLLSLPFLVRRRRG